MRDGALRERVRERRSAPGRRYGRSWKNATSARTVTPKSAAAPSAPVMWMYVVRLAEVGDPSARGGARRGGEARNTVDDEVDVRPGLRPGVVVDVPVDVAPRAAETEARCRRRRSRFGGRWFTVAKSTGTDEIGTVEVGARVGGTVTDDAVVMLDGNQRSSSSGRRDAVAIGSARRARRGGP